MPRFAILTHDHPFPHWDFLLEQGAACRTWRLLSQPDSEGEVAAEQLPDHRLLYLDYEGPVSAGRGVVTAWDRGTFEWITDQPEIIEVTLRGNTLSGTVRITRLNDGPWRWLRNQS